MNGILRRRRALMGATAGSGFAHGTWEDLFWHIDKGDYATAYSVGEEIATILTSGTSFPFQIVAFNADTISNTSDKAPVTLISKKLFVKRKFNDIDTNPVSDGNGTYGGWDMSNAREYCRTTALSYLPDVVKARLLEVKKYSRTRYVGGSFVNNTLTNDKIWLVGSREINAGSPVTAGPVYSGVFSDNTSRKKKYGSSDTAYWTRDTSSVDASKISTISTTGTGSSGTPEKTIYGYAIGFCVGGAQG